MRSTEKLVCALKIGTKNITMSVDPEKAALALELSKDRREDLERQVRFLKCGLRI
jgi:transposase